MIFLPCEFGVLLEDDFDLESSEPDAAAADELELDELALELEPIAPAPGAAFPFFFRSFSFFKASS